MSKQRTKRTMNDMTAEELRAATAEFDEEMVADGFGPPGSAQKARWERARRKPGRPTKGRGARVISVSGEMGLLAQADELAERMGLSRAALIARGLKAMLAAEGVL